MTLTARTGLASAQPVRVLDSPQPPLLCQGREAVNWTTTKKGKPMKIVVIGGTGLIGSKVVAMLREQGHEAVPASPRLGVNTLTGEGLAEALARRLGRRRRVQLAVLRGSRRCWSSSRPRPATSWPRKRPPAWAITSRCRSSASIGSPDKRLLPGQDRPGEADRSGTPIPYSIVRATQFFEFIDEIADAATDRQRRCAWRPCVPTDGGRRRRAARSPRSPSVRPAEWSSSRSPVPSSSASTTSSGGACRRATMRVEVIADPHARYFGAELHVRTLIPGDGALLGETHFADWLSQRDPAVTASSCPRGSRGGLRLTRSSSTAPLTRRGAEDDRPQSVSCARGDGRE